VTGKTTEALPDGAEGSTARRARVRWRRPVAIVLALIMVVLFVAWLERRTIARGFVDRELSKLGVHASYQIEQLSPWRQRLTNIVIGDPRKPDLVADWVELRTSLYPWRASILVLKAGQVKMRGRLAGGKLSLGTIDRLMPPSSGKPVTLPHIIIDVADGRMALDTPNGAVNLAMSGKGMLDNGFRGRLAVRSERLDIGGCAADGIRAAVALRIDKGQPGIEGPLQFAGIDCSTTRVARARVQVSATLGAALERWRGEAWIAAARLDQPQLAIANPSGRVDFQGNRARTSGSLSLASGAFRLPQGSGKALGAEGRYSAGGDGLAFEGTARARGAAASQASLAGLRAQASSAQGTPLGPIVAQLVQAAAGAGGAFDVEGYLKAQQAAGRTELSASAVRAQSASGTRAAFTGDLRLASPGAGPHIRGTLTLSGGRMPEAVVRLEQAAPGAPVTGTASIQPYVAGDTRLALGGVTFSAAPAGSVRLATIATLSGPLPGGRIDGLTLPLDARWGGGRLTVNPDCADASVARAAMSSLMLERARVRLCPIGAAMFATNGRANSGGIRALAPRLRGRIGESPLALAADHADFVIGTQRFAAAGLSARIGDARLTQLDLAGLEGGFSRGSPAGSFTGLAGRIGDVPLLVSGGAGNWRFAGGELGLNGQLSVADAVEPARFKPLASDDAVLTLANNRILATATLKAPQDTAVAEVRITHDLGAGSGRADLTVPGIRFAEGGLQPNDITPLTYGVIATVSGTVAGEARIDWDAAGVTSSGTFRSDGLDLAAAFGPVRKLAGEVRFSDLLGLRTAPGQSVTIAEINPGVPVTGGTIRFELLDEQRVRSRRRALALRGRRAGARADDPRFQQAAGTAHDVPGHRRRRSTVPQGDGVRQSLRHGHVRRRPADGLR
jgi:translocation and assembly module TamB